MLCHEVFTKNVFKPAFLACTALHIERTMRKINYPARMRKG